MGKGTLRRSKWVGCLLMSWLTLGLLAATPAAGSSNDGEAGAARDGIFDTVWIEVFDDAGQRVAHVPPQPINDGVGGTVTLEPVGELPIRQVQAAGTVWTENGESAVFHWLSIDFGKGPGSHSGYIDLRTDGGLDLTAHYDAERVYRPSVPPHSKTDRWHCGHASVLGFDEALLGEYRISIVACDYARP